MSVIFSIKDGKAAVDVDESKPLDILEARLSYQDVFIKLGADKDQSINEELMTLAAGVGDTSSYYVRFVEFNVDVEVPVPASPPIDALNYINNPENPVLTDEEMTERFGWNKNMMSATLSQIIIISPQYRE